MTKSKKIEWYSAIYIFEPKINRISSVFVSKRQHDNWEVWNWAYNTRFIFQSISKNREKVLQKSARKMHLGKLIPDFSAETTQGPIRFHDWQGDSYVLIHSLSLSSIEIWFFFKYCFILSFCFLVFGSIRWVVLFSHPSDFTPVCTTELGRLAVFKPQFDRRNAKLLAHSVDDLKSHTEWVNVCERISSDRTRTIF